MRAFINTEVTKPELLASLAAHRIAEGFEKGKSTYFEDGKGCAVGCTLHDFAPGQESDHPLYERLFGIPEALAWLEDSVFEGLSVEQGSAWPERFVGAIEPGADLTKVADRWLLWLLSDNSGTSPLAQWRDEPWMRSVADLYRRRLAGDEPGADEWTAARAAAEVAWADVSATSDSNAAADAVWTVRAAARAAANAGAQAIFLAGKTAGHAAWDIARAGRIRGPRFVRAGRFGRGAPRPSDLAIEAMWDAAMDTAWAAATDVMADALIGLIQSAPVQPRDQEPPEMEPDSNRAAGDAKRSRRPRNSQRPSLGLGRLLRRLLGRKA